MLIGDWATQTLDSGTSVTALLAARERWPVLWHAPNTWVSGPLPLLPRQMGLEPFATPGETEDEFVSGRSVTRLA